jgi:hypothetical protein
VLWRVYHPQRHEFPHRGAPVRIPRALSQDPRPTLRSSCEFRTLRPESRRSALPRSPYSSSIQQVSVWCAACYALSEPRLVPRPSLSRAPVGCAHSRAASSRLRSHRNFRDELFFGLSPSTKTPWPSADTTTTAARARCGFSRAVNGVWSQQEFRIGERLKALQPRRLSL